MYNLRMNSGAVVSISAATKKQVANASILFGRNAAVFIKRIDELVKIKELDTSKLTAILDMLKDEEATTAYAKKAAGKNLVTAMTALYKAKSLVATINGLRGLKIKPAASNELAPVPTKVTRAGSNGPTGATADKVTADRVNKNAVLPKIDLRRIGPKFMSSVTQTQVDAIAAALTEATGLPFVGTHTPSNGQSSDWTFYSYNPNSKFADVHIDPPYSFHEYESSDAWAIGATDKQGKIAIAPELRKPTPAAFAKAVGSLIGKAGKVTGSVKVKAVKMMPYNDLENLVYEDANDDVAAGHRYAVKVFSKFGLKPKSKDVVISPTSYGGMEEAIVVHEFGAERGFMFGPSTKFVDNIKQLKGKGTYTLVSWTRDGGKLPNTLPKSRFKQHGIFKTYKEMFVELQKELNTYSK